MSTPALSHCDPLPRGPNARVCAIWILAALTGSRRSRPGATVVTFPPDTPGDRDEREREPDEVDGPDHPPLP